MGLPGGSALSSRVLASGDTGQCPGCDARTLAMQNQAVPQDLIHLHSDVGHILGNGLDPFNEAGPRGEPRGEGRARDEPTGSLRGLPVDSQQRPQLKPCGSEA